LSYESPQPTAKVSSRSDAQRRVFFHSESSSVMATCGSVEIIYRLGRREKKNAKTREANQKKSSRNFALRELFYFADQSFQQSSRQPMHYFSSSRNLHQIHRRRRLVLRGRSFALQHIAAAAPRCRVACDLILPIPPSWWPRRDCCLEQVRTAGGSLSDSDAADAIAVTTCKTHLHRRAAGLSLPTCLRLIVGSDRSSLSRPGMPP